MKTRSTPSQYKVELFSHDPQWVVMYHDEAAKLAALFVDTLVSIHHFGSTSIPTIRAKPIIDILVQINSAHIPDVIISALSDNGYTERLFDDGRARRTFNKDNKHGVRLFNIHVVEQGNRFGQEMLQFCEVLRANPLLAKEYEAIKLQSAVDANDTQAYYKAKEYFFEQILSKA